MKRCLVLASTLAFAAGAAQAGDADFTMLDADQSGGLSLAEVQTTYPDAAAEDFARYDADASGELSADEYAIWIGAAQE